MAAFYDYLKGDARRPAAAREEAAKPAGERDWKLIF
jgi:hypothetical protein